MTSRAPDLASWDWPPPPHDPRERVKLFDVGSWEVRAFALDDPKHGYFAPRGLLHLQLWDPARGVSVLTPSRLTRGRFEVFPVRGWKATADDHAGLRALLAVELGLQPPSAATLLSLVRWFVRRYEGPS